MDAVTAILAIGGTLIGIYELAKAVRFVLRHPDGGLRVLLRMVFGIIAYFPIALLPIGLVIWLLPTGPRPEIEALLLTLATAAWILLSALWLARLTPPIGEHRIPSWLARRWWWPDRILLAALFVAVAALIYTR